ncbi:Clp protease ClpP [Paenibacillus psychroresistens]|uniref:ATP-dependent Clp protease proteolytic subunit n=1 Tax=Paenibacillus psychroresistens TaxID=1778678 RepID=A0A6B8RP22_9BACL|nr:head maturation protease, ClpP-related [Paenibacillus psychroresistens]QGQ97068.1 Clp protease ClpP [Paenibacillus psychroresistens]
MPKKINLKGIIVSNDDIEIYDWFGIEAVSPNKIADQLTEANGEDIEVYINSPGGSVWAGSDIYASLKEYSGNSVSKIVGMCASAAGVAAMGTKKLMIAPTAQFMIHNAANGQYGDYRDMQKNADFLKQVNDSIANAYILKTGLPRDELLNMMDHETFFTAQQALEKGFADEIMFDDANQLKLVANLGVSFTLPQAVMDKARNELLKNKLPPIEPEPKGEEGDDSLKDLDELKTKHPEIYNAAIQVGLSQERNRITELNSLAGAPGAKDIVAKAITEGSSAAQAAMDIVKASAERLTTEGQKRLYDAKNSGAEGVLPGDPDDTKPTPEAQSQEDADDILEEMKKLRGGRN